MTWRKAGQRLYSNSHLVSNNVATCEWLWNRSLLEIPARVILFTRQTRRLHSHCFCGLWLSGVNIHTCYCRDMMNAPYNSSQPIRCTRRHHACQNIPPIITDCKPALQRVYPALGQQTHKSQLVYFNPVGHQWSNSHRTTQRPNVYRGCIYYSEVTIFKWLRFGNLYALWFSSLASSTGKSYIKNLRFRLWLSSSLVTVGVLSAAPYNIFSCLQSSVHCMVDRQQLSVFTTR